MSASLVRKSLLIVDSEHKAKNITKKKNCSRTILNNGGLKQKSNSNCSPSSNKKLTVTEARKKFKSKEQILKENLKKLELIRKIDKVNLEEEIVNQIIERAVTKKPIRKIKKNKKDKKTAFTEEDFKKFEKEYFDE